jgi:CubicO group peptidase (beta-lactamase class C family)
MHTHGTTRGLSQPRLERLHRGLAAYVERQELPGLVALVSRDDDVHVETLGTLAFGQPAPMRRDTLFRIASLAKPVTAVAAMILVEECRLRLDDPIDRWLPELANRRVLKTLASPLDDTVPARRAITLRDLLTYRMGFGSVMEMPDTYPIQRAIRELQIGGDGPPLPSLAPATEEWLRRLASLPLMAQPGEKWMYHVSGDVLGVLIERAAGESLGSFLRRRIFEPLGMTDTAFHVPADKLARLATSYRFNPQTHVLDIYDDPAHSTWHPEPPFESGGGGLVSTLDDYFAFCRMLLHRGRHGDEHREPREPILSRAAVELMTTDHLTADHRAGSDLFFGTHTSWGLGMAVDIRRTDLYRNPGRFGWDGGLGTSAYTDPNERAIGLLFTQRMMDSPEAPNLYNDFWTLAYGAME